MRDSNACIILAGGLGTRLRSAVPDKPKCLASIGKKSFLEVQLELLASQGVNRFILSLGYLASMVLEEVTRLQSRFDIQTVIEPQPLGTGGAILWTMQRLALSEVIVANGDTFLSGSLSEMFVPLDIEGSEFVRLAIVDVPNCSRYGKVNVSGNRLIGFTAKGISQPGAINAGIYRLSLKAFNALVPGLAYSFESDVLPKMIDQKSVSASHITGEFTDIGVPEDYLQFNRLHA
jgi:D-glycero-alpha-D-manno-heptose 1-phosphate guanylyltransferase